MNIENKDQHDLDRDLLAFKNMQKGGDKSQEIVNAIKAIDDENIRRNTPEEPLYGPVIYGQRNKSGGYGSPKNEFKSMGEMLQATAKAAMPGKQTDPRLFNAATGLGETVSSDGGFLVHTDFSTDLLGSIFKPGTLASRCNKFTISGNSNGIKLPMVDETNRSTGRSGGVVSYWTGEGVTATATKPKFRNLNLDLQKLVSICYTTDELLADSSVLERYVTQAFHEEIKFQVEDSIINGSGAGKPLGILNGAGLVTQAKEGGQVADTVVFENILKMYARLLPGSLENAVFICNSNVLPQLYQMSLAVGTGGAPVYLPPTGASGSPYASLFGLPLIVTEQCATVGDVGDIMLCDFNGGYVCADKGDIRTDMSIHVEFLADQSVFRFVYRFAGQPTLNSAITPFKGSDTLGHFVALAAR
jgi:HK97 family phage major capsid protein